MWAGSILWIVVISVGVGATNMKVFVAPDIILFGSASSRGEKEKGNLILNCTALSYNPQWVGVNWTRTGKDDVMEYLEDKYITTNVSNGKMISSYNSNHKAMHSDAGNYTCIFFNKNTSAFINGTMFPVKTAPYPGDHNVHRLKEHNNAFFRAGKSGICDIGKSVRIQCNVIGFPKPTVTWHRVAFGMEDAEMLINASLVNLKENQTRIIGNELELDVKDVNDRGYYLCIANNGVDPPLHIFTLVRARDVLAPLWPFLVLVAEFVALGLIIGLCELRRKRLYKDEDDSGSKSQTPFRSGNASTSAANVNSADLRQRSLAKGGT